MINHDFLVFLLKIPNCGRRFVLYHIQQTKAMDKHNIRIPASSYKKLYKKLMKYGIKIGGMSVRNFLVAHSIVEDTGNPPDIRTKRIILHIAGDFDSEPAELLNWVNIETNLLFSFNEYSLLLKRLNHLVKEYDKSARISAKEVQACKTVSDCLDLVTSKIAQKIKAN
jgi:hypothetical protein